MRGNDFSEVLPDPIVARPCPHAYILAEISLLRGVWRQRVKWEAAVDGATGIRTVRTKGALSQDTARLMVFKLVMAAARTWRRLKGENQCR